VHVFAAPSVRRVSFAQNFEDVMLLRALKSVERGFYIDVGAASPEVDSVTRAFYDRGWHGINVEPHPDLYEELVIARPRDITLNVALGERVARLPMTMASHAALSTLDPRQARQLERDGMPTSSAEVEVQTLQGIWDAHVPEVQAVHFLKIDVEGHERAVLLGNDWRSHRPWVVVVEATRPQSTESSHGEWQDILAGAAFGFVYADGLNRFYLAEEHRELTPAFEHPPNVFDDFVRASEVQAWERVSRAEAELAAIQASRSWRVTAPLRAMAGVLRGLRRPSKA
jgi:FkbM family methyltransferase